MTKFKSDCVDEERSKTRVNDLIEKISKSISMIHQANELMKFECEANDWWDEVCDDVDEGLLKLGCSLAALVRWYDEDEDENKNDI